MLLGACACARKGGRSVGQVVRSAGRSDGVAVGRENADFAHGRDKSIYQFAVELVFKIQSCGIVSLLRSSNYSAGRSCPVVFYMQIGGVVSHPVLR